MNTQADLWFLENVNLFEFLCPNKRNTAAGVQQKSIFKKGEFIFFPDEPSDQIYLLERGRVKIGAYSSEGKEVIKAILQPGEVFGELGIVGEIKRNNFAQAMEDVEVCSMMLSDLKLLMLDSKDFSLKLTKLIGTKLIKAERRLESLIFKDARTRIVEFVRDLAVEKGEKVGEELLVRTFMTHKEIAYLTGTSRQTVTTVLNDLRDKNLIYFDRKRLLVRDPDKLE